MMFPQHIGFDKTKRNKRTRALILKMIICLAVGLQASLSSHAQPFEAPHRSVLPNVVIILADDAALMDLGAYGGEANTPNIDALANQGAVFTQYRTSPLCSPTRAMLLTGIDNHRTGVATIPEVLPPEQQGQPGYAMSLEPGVLTLADRLGAEGYRTLMTGKWHLGEAIENLPHRHGFDRSFSLAASGADNWEDKSYMPYYAEAPWWEDGQEVSLPEDFYSSKFIIDKMMEYISVTDPSQPFFAYLPFQAVHIPVQAPPEFTANYKGRFDAGWDVLRAERHRTAQALGLIPQGAPLGPMTDDSRPWDSLSPNEQRLYAARMEVNAGMIEAMDYHIGRFIEFLKTEGHYENTIFVITSDNGPEPTRGDNDWRISLWMALNGYHTGLEKMGERGTWGFIGPEWAQAAATPGSLYKFYATEGGIRAPLIISGGGLASMRIDSPAMVTDIAPTLLDWIGIPLNTPQARPITGRSLLPVLHGETQSVYAPGDVRAIEVSGNSALYLDDYKITRSVPPVGDGNWRLFDIKNDPSETTDLSSSKPEVFAKLLSAYADYAAEMGVLEMPPGYDSVKQIDANISKKMLERHGPILALIGLLLLTLVFGLWRAARRLMQRKRV